MSLKRACGLQDIIEADGVDCWSGFCTGCGDRTVVDLLAEVTARGLTTVPTPKNWPS